MPRAPDDTPALDTSFHDHEMAVDTSSDRTWYRWIASAEKALGIADLDGDEAVDGYSLDSAYEAFEAGVTASAYAGGWRPASVTS